MPAPPAHVLFEGSGAAGGRHHPAHPQGRTAIDPAAQIMPPVSTKYRCHRLCHLQMSLGSGAEPLAQRSARPARDAAEQEAALVVLARERQLARLVEKLSRP